MKRFVNHKFFKDDEISKEKYYIAGWLSCAEMSIVKNRPAFMLKTDINNINVINYIKMNICKDHILKIKNKSCSISFISDKIKEDIDSIKEYVKILSKDNSMFKNFMIGVMEASSIVLRNNCILFDSQIEHVSYFLNELKIPFSNMDSFIKVYHVNAIDLMGYMYQDEESWINKGSLFNYFCKVMNSMDTCKMEYKSESSILKKTHFTDAGMDISITSKDNDFSSNSNCMRFNTNLSVNIPSGYWGMLCPRSSFSKSGFMMSNSFGVIDSSYRGQIKITLTRTGDVEFKDIKFPFSCAQIILIPQVFAFVNKVDEFSKEDKTARNEGGHGSTDL
jgi:dUTP pyrophosphatase